MKEFSLKIKMKNDRIVNCSFICFFFLRFKPPFRDLPSSVAFLRAFANRLQTFSLLLPSLHFHRSLHAVQSPSLVLNTLGMMRPMHMLISVPRRWIERKIHILIVMKGKKRKKRNAYMCELCIHLPAITDKRMHFEWIWIFNIVIVVILNDNHCEYTRIH